MNKTLLTILLAIGFCDSAFAQSEVHLVDKRVFTGVGTSTETTQVLTGVGLDLNFTPSIGIAADGDIWFSKGGIGLGTLLAGVVYRFNPSHSTVPYIRAGFAGHLSSDPIHGLHFGAGIDQRIRPHLSLQAEGLLLTTQNSNVEFRLGVVFH